MKTLLAVLLFSALALFSSAAAQRIVILKGARRLELYADGKVVKTYRVGLGSNPTGTKLRQGDGRTPEGTFYVCVKNPQSKFHRSLGLSYPAPADAARGLAEKLITRAQRDAIVQAHQKHTTPPWNTALGGEVFIHGCGSGSDWTLGCIALDDADMTGLFATIVTGTSVEIRP
jgi:murein L,D-transpeptidase YafK